MELSREKKYAAILSILIPGLGQIFCFRYAAGAVSFTAFALLNFFPQTALFSPIICLLSAIEAYINAKVRVEDESPKPKRLKLFLVVGMICFFFWFFGILPIIPA